MPLDLHDFDGPLGAFERGLAARRIAVVTDRAGRICLVRPDSLIVQSADQPAGSRAALTTGRLELLGEDPPAARVVAARHRPARRPQRWRTGDLRDVAAHVRQAFGADAHHVRAHQVYLSDGVGRDFRRVGEGGAAGTPGLTSPAAAFSTVRPAVEPRDLPDPLALAGRRAPIVLVLDTGLRTIDAHSTAEHEWLRSHTVVHETWRDLRTVGRWDDEDEPDDDFGGRLDQQAGHGTFITGIIRQQCPDAIVHHRGVLTSYGDGDDASIGEGVRRAIATIPHIDVAVMAFGTYGIDDADPVLADEVAALQARGVVVVASAGNDGTSRPFFPAALPGVVAVAGVDEDRRARFSNFGPWVDACAPAVDVVSTFFTDFDDRCDCCGTVTDRYRGWARWSGTSFATPKVAGLIAQEMYLHELSAVAAWRRLQALARFRVPGLGVLFNV